MITKTFTVSINDIQYHRGSIPVFSGSITCNEKIYAMFLAETGLNQEEAEAFNDMYDGVLTQPQSFGTAYLEWPVHKGFCVSLGISKWSYDSFKEMSLEKFSKLVQKSFTKEKYDKACDTLGKIIKLMKEEVIKVKERMEEEEEEEQEQEQNIIDEFMTSIICKLKYSKFAEDGKNESLLVSFVEELLWKGFIDTYKILNYQVTERQIIEKIFENYDVINGKIVKKQQ